MKQIIRLTESDLHNIIRESVVQILNENPAAAGAAGTAMAAGLRVAAPIIVRQGAKILGKQAVKQGAKQGVKALGGQAAKQGAKQGVKALGGQAAKEAGKQGAKSFGSNAAAQGGKTAGNASSSIDMSRLLNDPNFLQSVTDYGKKSQEANSDMRDSTIDYAKDMMNNKEGFKGYANKTLDYAKKMGNGISKNASAGLKLAADNPELTAQLLKSLA